MTIKGSVVVTDPKTLSRIMRQDVFVTMPKGYYDELVQHLEYLEEGIEALRAQFQDTRSLEEIVEQYEDKLDEQLAASPAFRKRIAEARANYAAGKGGHWDHLTRQRKRKQK